MRATAVVIGIVWVPLLASFTVDATIYRCRDGAGNIMYSDTACAGGSVVPIVESRADPAAIERLKREAEAFEARQARRDAIALEEARSRERRAPREAQPVEQEPVYYPGYYYGGHGGYGGYGRYGGYGGFPPRAGFKPPFAKPPIARPPFRHTFPPHIPANLPMPIPRR
jgi:hypothetical protein